MCRCQRSKIQFYSIWCLNLKAFLKSITLSKERKKKKYNYMMGSVSLKYESTTLDCGKGHWCFGGETWYIRYKRDNKFFKVGDFNFYYQSTIMIVLKIGKYEKDT